MSETLTPPPASQPPASEPTPSRPAPSGRGGPVVIAILTIALGVAVIVGTLAATSARAVAAARLDDASLSADAAGVSALDVDVSAAELSVEFADVDEAVLDVTRSAAADRWRLERDGDRLVVSTPPRSFFGFGWFFGGNGTAVLTLPERWERTSLDASFALSAGSIAADATWGDLAVTVSAGEADIDGTADTVEAEVSAGTARLDLADVTRGAFDVSAGEIVAHLDGVAPDDVTVSVSAGSLRLTVPDEVYDVDIDVSAGDVTNRLETSTQSDRRIIGDVSAGDMRLTPGS